MDKLSQRKLLEEGFVDKIRKLTKPVAKGIAAAGGAIAAASQAGIDAGISDVVKGAKAGFEAEKSRQKTKENELDDFIETLGYIKLGKERGKGDILVVDVADLEYDDEGNRKKGTRYSRPLVLQWDKDSKSFSTVRSPRGQDTTKKDEDEEVKNEKSSQIDLLRQLTLLSK